MSRVRSAGWSYLKAIFLNCVEDLTKDRLFEEINKYLPKDMSC